MANLPKNRVITLRLSEETHAKLERSRNWLPYKTTTTAIIERGIELALSELDAMRVALGRAEDGAK